MEADERFRALFEAAYPALRRYAVHRGLGPADADDLVAATLEVAWRRRRVVPVDDAMPWLYAVARNLWRNQSRAAARSDTVIERLRFEGAPRAPVEAIWWDADVLRAALGELDDDDQELLRLVAWDGLTPSQAAVVLGCSQVAARARLHRARARLAAKLGFDPRLQRSTSPRQEEGDDAPGISATEARNG